LSKIIEERSAGAIIFCRDSNGIRKYLLLKRRKGYYDFPKGNIETGEKPLDTAIREIREETGLENIRFCKGFKKMIEYYYIRSGYLVHKKVVFYLAEAYSTSIKLSKEHIDYVWLPYSEAIKVARYKNARKLLRAAEDYLMNAECLTDKGI